MGSTQHDEETAQKCYGGFISSVEILCRHRMHSPRLCLIPSCSFFVNYGVFISTALYYTQEGTSTSLQKSRLKRQGYCCVKIEIQAQFFHHASFPRSRWRPLSASLLTLPECLLTRVQAPYWSLQIPLWARDFHSHIVNEAEKLTEMHQHVQV